MIINNTGEKIFEEAVTALSDDKIGIEMKGPDTLIKEADEQERKARADPIITKSYTLKEHEHYLENEMEKISAKRQLAENLRAIIAELAEKSKNNIIHNEDKFFILPDYAWSMMDQNAKNATGNPRAGFAIGGISPWLFENNQTLGNPVSSWKTSISIVEDFPATQDQYLQILDSLKKYKDDGIIIGSSIPVLAEGLGSFELTKLMFNYLSGILLKTWLRDASDEQIKEAASWDLVYDCYCPSLDVLSYNPEIVWDMMRSVKAGSDIGATLMPRFPYCGITPRLCMSTAMIELIGLLCFCLTLNPAVKIMIGVMFEILRVDGTMDADLLSTWRSNIYWGQLMDIYGFDHILSAGAVSNYSDFDKQKRQMNADTHACVDFFNQFAPTKGKRHIVGHGKGLDKFYFEKMHSDCEYIRSNGNDKKTGQHDIHFPDEPRILSRLRDSKYSWRNTSLSRLDPKLSGLARFTV